jgi:very-short-patch-repair endonuclease
MFTVDHTRVGTGEMEAEAIRGAEDYSGSNGMRFTKEQYAAYALRRPKASCIPPIIDPKRRGSKLEHSFLRMWSGPSLVREHRFDPKRRWRFDFAHIASRTAIEIEGGTWGKSRHTTGKGFEVDCEKYNAATMAGWRVIRLTNRMINSIVLMRIAIFIERTP